MAVYQSSFKISQDPTYIRYTMESSFKEDYLPLNTNSRSNICAAPLAANIMHRDDYHLGHVGNSITRNEFVDRGSAFYSQQRDAYGNNTKERALRATTFKMFTDPVFRGGISTNSESYRRHPIVAEPSSKPKLSTANAGIAFGDVMKTEIPISDYRKSFTAHAVSRPKFATKEFFISNKGTLAGDRRNPQSMYTTTSQQAHTGKYVEPPPLANIPLLGSNLPQGDREKLAVKSTLHQETFVPLNAKPAKPTSAYNFQETTFRLGSNDQMFNTTSQDAFNPKITDATNKSKSLRFKHIQSSLPGGDLDYQRGRERTSTTTFKSDYPQYLDHTATRAGNTSRHAVSSVRISGEKNQNYFKTEMSSAFIPMRLEKNLMPKQLESSVPLKYYERSDDLPETKDMYRPLPLQVKEKAIHQNVNQQRKTHAKIQDYRLNNYQTIHQSDYKPKRGDRADIVNHRLQYSSVPLHTLNQDV
ncbi:uncharacterized protein TRIADDRAFT_54649 [Trichoplax adhaerens]|uniref:Uncharacterized protein n=1 Tax=Trichoplax adhaerens TaxID=10228 RepID=B3RSM0_TRIAD|nr:hypothetical protein TRIADDRAFT_54649 [Trichoplax adhaerens]EDV26537.1 hypothetical protein TRIADDRAFT_54649 [Trichoplax adhaerens]|eukprot:XP_002110533.1 hypothetical protein TRIADDRAFT_54649 [Trichoplax adhaerens]